ncbi:MAG TPA: hypothetical protein VII61_11160 [Ktedonobacteraceae bacterium]
MVGPRGIMNGTRTPVGDIIRDPIIACRQWCRGAIYHPVRPDHRMQAMV